MQTHRLLERVRHRSAPLIPTSDTRQEQLTRSISHYLVKLLNTQQGNAQISCDFGMPDLNHYRYGGGIKDINAFQRVIIDTIKRFEPRVADVMVNFVPQQSNPLGMVFHIDAKIQLENEQIALVFETVLGADGRIRVDEI
ncbi:type VI secretion system baseplate subunit TssE [Vibrio profundum]|uniref:type VI secretion system baseplate subunit TssE n=1 Tax=Vibrio profundum TaxID=2910247 RepID=UPI003D1328E3